MKFLAWLVATLLFSTIAHAQIPGAWPNTGGGVLPKPHQTNRWNPQLLPYQPFPDNSTITVPGWGGSYSITLGSAGFSRQLGCPQALQAGSHFLLRFQQDGTGGRLLTFAPCWFFTGGIAPTLTTTANGVDLLVGESISTTEIDVGAIVSNLAQVSDFVQTGANGSTANGSTIAETFPAAVGSTHLQVCAISWVTGVTLSSVVDSASNTFTIVDTQANSGSSNFTMATTYFANTSGSPSSVTATFSGTSGFSTIVCNEYANVTTLAQHAILDQPSTGTGTNAISSGSITTTVPSLIIGLTTNGGHSTNVAGTGFSLRGSTTLASNDWTFSEDLQQLGAGAVAATFTGNASDQSVTAVMAFH